MKILCKVAGLDCPKDLQICCGLCEDKFTCDSSCEQVYNRERVTLEDCAACEDAEVITDELVQFQSATPEAVQQITQLVILKKQLEDQEKHLKEELTKAMEVYGVKSFENDQIKLVYVAPTTRSTIDSARLKKDHPDLAQRYTKTSNVSASVRITVK
jgi:hypothetical protein